MVQLLAMTVANPPLVHWYVAVYPVLNDTPIGKPCCEIREWLIKKLALAKEMVQYASTQAIVFIYPLHAPDPVCHVRSAVQRNPEWSGWSPRCVVLRNNQHGGYIETEHAVLLLIPDCVAKLFTFNEVTCDPQPLSAMLDDEDRAYDAIWLQGLRFQTPTPVQHATMSYTLHSAKVAKFVKFAADAAPPVGWPAYSTLRPGPDLSKNKTIIDGRFFGGSAFAIWIQQHSCGPVCHHIRPH